MPIQRDAFIPKASDSDVTEYPWWTWLTDAHLQQNTHTGKVAGLKETRGDNALKHHRLHNRPDHCFPVAIHCRWNAHYHYAQYSFNVSDVQELVREQWAQLVLNKYLEADGTIKPQYVTAYQATVCDGRQCRRARSQDRNVAAPVAQGQ
eukprot:837685-Amphidinium_carterae.1